MATHEELRKGIGIGYREERMCAVPGCKNHGRRKGYYQGRARFGKLCAAHHKQNITSKR